MSSKTPPNLSAAEQRVEALARERALRQARRVAWPQLLAAQERYLNSQEFYFWARAIIDTERGIPDFLMPLLEQQCPGFLNQKEHSKASSRKVLPDLALDLWDWIDEQCCGEARRDGWFDAIEYFAVRHPRYQRAQSYWLQCRQAWQQDKPDRYPGLDEWRLVAAGCTPEAVAEPEARQVWEALGRVNPERLEEAVRAYLDWEAFTYWVRTPLEVVPENLPAQVQSALEERCPGFLDHDRQQRSADPAGRSQAWSRLTTWGRDHLFAEAKNEGWLEAILYCVSIHPRSLRTQDYWLVWDEQWSPEVAYPSFEQWLQQVDQYVQLPSA